MIIEPEKSQLHDSTDLTREIFQNFLFLTWFSRAENFSIKMVVFQFHLFFNLVNRFINYEFFTSKNAQFHGLKYDDSKG